MPFKSKERHNEYFREYKRRRNIEDGLLREHAKQVSKEMLQRIESLKDVEDLLALLNCIIVEINNLPSNSRFTPYQKLRLLLACVNEGRQLIDSQRLADATREFERFTAECKQSSEIPFIDKVNAEIQ